MDPAAAAFVRVSDGIPAIIRSLMHRNPLVRKYAARELFKRGGIAKEAVSNTGRACGMENFVNSGSFGRFDGAESGRTIQLGGSIEF